MSIDVAGLCPRSDRLRRPYRNRFIQQEPYDACRLACEGVHAASLNPPAALDVDEHRRCLSRPGSRCGRPWKFPAQSLRPRRSGWRGRYREAWYDWPCASEISRANLECILGSREKVADAAEVPCERFAAWQATRDRPSPSALRDEPSTRRPHPALPTRGMRTVSRAISRTPAGQRGGSIQGVSTESSIGEEALSPPPCPFQLTVHLSIRTLRSRGQPNHKQPCLAG